MVGFLSLRGNLLIVVALVYGSQEFQMILGDVWLQLGEKNYSNNSIINITDISEDQPLFCHTSNNTNHLEWSFPSGEMVVEKNMNDTVNFYISQGADSDPTHPVLHLHRRDTAIMPTGIFLCTCAISDRIHTTTKHLYVGIYESMSGGHLSIVSLVYSNSSLICTSTGGPATNVTWTHDVNGHGQTMTLNGSIYEQNQILVYTENATYVNVLHSTEHDKLMGTIRCRVSNVRSTARSTCNVISSGQIETTDDGSTPLAGQNYSLVCTFPGVNSENSNQNLTWWANGNGSVVSNSTTLFFSPLRLSDAGQYTCYVSSPCMGRNITTHKNVEIKIPSPTSVNITSNTTLPVWPMGAIITLNCTFELRPVVDVPVNITIEWIGPNGEILNSSHIGSNNRTVITITNTFRALAPGEYICNVSSIHSSSPYLIHSTPHQSGSFNITIDALNKSTTAMVTAKSSPPMHVTQTTTQLLDHDESNIIPLPVIVGSTVAVPVLLVCGCVIVIVAALQRRNRKPKVQEFNISKPTLYKSLPQFTETLQVTSGQSETLEVTEMTDTFDKPCFDITDEQDRLKPILLANFVQYVDHMHKNLDELFQEEFKSLCTNPQSSYIVSDIYYNQEKNRFVNIFPYDYNRVKLKSLPTMEGSDYINASFLNGYFKQKAYVAAQGPLPNSLEDFWRMIWEQKLPTVVMLTKCFEERVKCERYWPENKEKVFCPGSNLAISLKSSIPFSEFIIRKLSVQCGSEPDAPPLEVTQFHYTVWPDHSVPSNTSAMLNIIKRIRKLHPYSDPQPLLVHCSAGVGRTGTFIVLDIMLERMKAEKSFNIYAVVQQLRKERVFMVQSLAQYMFIHDAMKEFIMCGETEILAPNLGILINKLGRTKLGITGFEQQFQILEKLCPKLDDDSFVNAKAQCNINKNRYSDKLPCKGFSRTVLRWNGEQGSDYINASYIDGYKQRRAYIATQGPLESTVNDFWRMVWEQKSCCIVMLCQLEENEKEMSVHYWPAEKGEPEIYDKITVKKLSQVHIQRGDYVMRTFEVDYSGKHLSSSCLSSVKTAVCVTQFQFLAWPEYETPPNSSSLIELVENVNKVQMKSHNRPMIVMCNDGVGRTGTFICIHAQLERLKTEGVIDFFQFVKSARIQRPQLILNTDQYELCHTTVLQYVQRCDNYANFKDVV